MSASSRPRPAPTGSWSRARSRSARERWCARVLDALAPGAHVINVGRGEVVVEAQLIEALQRERLAGAFLDVFEHEPLAHRRRFGACRT